MAIRIVMDPEDSWTFSLLYPHDFFWLYEFLNHLHLFNLNSFFRIIQLREFNIYKKKNNNTIVKFHLQVGSLVIVLESRLKNCTFINWIYNRSALTLLRGYNNRPGWTRFDLIRGSAFETVVENE